MHLRFVSRALEDLCNCGESLDRKWGKQVGASIRSRLVLMSRLPSLDLLRKYPGAILEPLKLNRQGQLAVEVKERCRIVVQPDHDPVPCLSNGSLACKKIERLIIVEVDVYGC